MTNKKKRCIGEIFKNDTRSLQYKDDLVSRIHHMDCDKDQGLMQDFKWILKEDMWISLNIMILRWKLAWSVKIKHMERLSCGDSSKRSKVKHTKVRVSDEEINRDDESEVPGDLMVGRGHHCVIA